MVVNHVSDNLRVWVIEWDNTGPGVSIYHSLGRKHGQEDRNNRDDRTDMSRTESLYYHTSVDTKATFTTQEDRVKVNEDITCGSGHSN